LTAGKKLIKVSEAMDQIKHGRIAVILTSLLVLMLAVGGAGCQNARVEERGRNSSGTRFDYRDIKLENGLDVITLEDFSCPIAAVQLWYHVGSKNEQADRQGFAHMFEHMMFRGTDKLGPTDHFSFIHRVGGTANGYTGFDRTVYVQTLPANQIELALWLEAERMTFLKIDQESFDTERKVVEEERRMRLNEPYGTIVENLLGEVFKVHPYRWSPIGNIAHLRASSAAELRDFWQRYYVPSNATLIIVGAVRHEKAQELAKRYFGWIPHYEEPAKVSAREPEVKESRSVSLKEDNAPAPGVGVVFRTVPIKDKDSVAIELSAEILGGGNSSRLYRELVAERQLAVAAKAETWELEQDGLFGAGAVMPPLGSDAEMVAGIIENHIARLRESKVSERELTKAKNQMLRDLVTQNLHIESKARMLGSAAVEYGDVSYVNRWLDDIRKVTADDIVHVANEYLTPERELRVKVERHLPEAVADKKKTEEQAPITGEIEKGAPKPGRPGLERSEDFPKEPPFGKISAAKITPKYSRGVLDNGLKVLVVENHEVPFVTVRLGLLAGVWTEDKPGTAAMTTSMLVKGTNKHSEAQLADELETYAIGLSGSADMDTSTVNMSCLTEHIERGMRLLGEIVLEPNFPEDEFEKLRRQVLTSLAISSAEPEYVAERELRRRLYGEHPYSRTAVGEVEDVNALAVGDLKQWWSKFVRPDAAVLIFAGDINKKKAFELAKSTLGNWRVTATQPKVKLPQLCELDGTHIYLVDRPGSIQSQIRVGRRGITRHNKMYPVSRVVSNYFGWGYDSRLNESVRVAKGLTYDIWGSFVAKRFAGEFEVGTFSKTQATAQTVRAVLDEIERLKKEGPSNKELSNSQSYILGSFVRGRETPQQIADDLWLIESQELGSDYLERLLKGVGGTKRDDCERLIDTTIKPDELVVVVVGQADALKGSLEKIAPVTVIAAEKKE
jgi:zinc protease